MKTQNLSIGILTKCALIVLLVVLISGICVPAMGQPETLMEKAIVEFENANYPGAIEYLQLALAESPDDADVYYYMGYFTHYLCYDSVPLTGFGREKSDEVLHYLQKAVELDPNYGNAYYFIGTEYGARARDEMQRGNVGGVIQEFRQGKQAGGYPDWLIEFGRNTLRSCNRDAILFTGGDAGTNSIQYLQWVEGYRTDVTVIPGAFLDRPWFVAFLKQGVDSIVRPAPISWSDQQIESMHPYKWKTNTIRIPIPDSVRQAYGAEQPAMEYELSPNLGWGETLGLLSAGRAAFADILLTNKWERPIYFSMGCSPSAWEGLRPYIQLSGFAQRLLPFKPPTSVDIEKTKTLLLDDNNYRFLPTVRDTDMPRASSLLQNYRACFMRLIYQYAKNSEIEAGKVILAAMDRNVPEDILPILEQFESNIDALRQMLNKSE